MRSASLTPPTPTSPSFNTGRKCRLESLLREASIRRDGAGVRHRLPAQELRLPGLPLKGPHSGRDDVDGASLRWRVGGGGGGSGGGGLQDPPQRLEVVERLVLLGGVAGAVIRGVGVREAQHPQAVGRHHQVSLLGMEGRARRRPWLHLQKERESLGVNSGSACFIQQTPSEKK